MTSATLIWFFPFMNYSAVCTHILHTKFFVVYLTNLCFSPPMNRPKMNVQYAFFVRIEYCMLHIYTALSHYVQSSWVEPCTARQNEFE